jgi:hypothetical protein
MEALPGSLRDSESRRQHGALFHGPKRPVKSCRPRARSGSLQRSGAAGGPVAPPVWDKGEYAVTDDGPLLVRVVSVQGPEWIRKYQRWSIRLECEGVFETVSLSLFISLSDNPSGPSVGGRQSKFYRHWSMANGGPPKKGQAMNWDAFVDKFFMAEVKKSTKNGQGEVKEEEEIYSRITHFVRREEM